MNIIIFILSFLFLNSSLQAKEYISHYQIVIDIQEDNSAIITEKIIANVESREIKKGITKLFSLEGDLIYKPISVKRNNVYEPFSIEILDNLYGIITGTDYFLPTFKKHLFEIKYKVNNIVEKGEDFNRLEWKPMNKKERLNIEKTFIKIRIPENMEGIGQFTYIRLNNNVKLIKHKNNIFKYNKTITPNEDMTMVVLLKEKYKASGVLDKNFKKTLLISFFGLPLFCIFLLCLVKKGNRNLSPFERYDVIKNITPAEAADIYYMGKDRIKASLISVISMIVDGFLVISKSKLNKYILSKTEYYKLQSKEEAIFDDTYKKDLKISKDCARQTRIFNDRLKYIFETNKPLYFKENIKIFFISFSCFTLSFLALLFFKYQNSAVDLNLAIITSIFIFSGALIFSENFKIFFKTFILILAVIIGLSRTQEIHNTSFIIIYYLLFASLILFIFKRLVRNYTDEGQEVIAHLEGVKLFIQYAELDQKKHPYRDMELLTPYSLIFNLENYWLDKLKMYYSSLDKKDKIDNFFKFLNKKDLDGLSESFIEACKHKIKIKKHLGD